MPNDLLTKQGEELLAANETPWQIYPRPQMRRDSYFNLNGWWEFAGGENEEFKQIRVPFCPESQLSGIKAHFEEGTALAYRRRFTLPDGFRKDRVLLHIGAADQVAVVVVNDQFIGTHQGGYEAFTFDITDALRDGENQLEITCCDDLRDTSFPYGKQVMKRGGMWYTPVSGIWQTVWLESVSSNYIQKLTIKNHNNSVTISTQPEMAGTITVKGLGTYPLGSTITPENPHFWSPEDPYLYDFVVETETDRVESYFAIRSLSIREIHGIPRLCLNGKPYFFHGLLDQGYWPDGLFTPAKPECYAEDSLAMKNLGFNTLRKHIKVEPEEFYYQCDKLGMIVFQDMVNNGPYSFFRDTLLPTIGIQKLGDKSMHKDPIDRQRFRDGMATTVNQLKNHPCICYWTIFNEGWGQFDSDAVCEEFRRLDDTRFIDATSGWFRRNNTDVDSRHVYFKPVRLKATDKPLVLSEFGGYSHKISGHVFNTEQTYGYGKYENRREFEKAVVDLYTNQIIPAKKAGLCAAIYTQVSDVEDETNGLVTYDRKIAKLRPEVMLPIAQALK